ncbi:MAG: DHH family phosphoesterase [Coriobacteriales bacterium]|jgi:phosphoesterase RecJ-like protein|nr:DHH family phosphoesterase [Coriobacteriales bacterium]
MSTLEAAGASLTPNELSAPDELSATDELSAPDELSATDESLTSGQTLDLLHGPGEAVVCGHTNPDGDALGSNLALAALLRARGYRVTSLLAQDVPAPELYGFLEDYTFVPAAAYKGEPDLFVAVDAPNADRLDDGREVLARSRHSLCIDHHPDYDGFADAYFGDSGAAATGVLIWRLLKDANITIDKSIAEYCYIALVTDTGRFAFQNTNAEALVAASEMVSAGVEPSWINLMVYDQKPMAALQLDARLISRIAFADEGRVVYSWVDEADFIELGLKREESEGLPSILRSVKGADIAILLRQEGENTRVNLRAKDICDVGEIARRMGGGGHKAAAGFTLKKPLQTTLDMLLSGTAGLNCYRK